MADYNFVKIDKNNLHFLHELYLDSFKVKVPIDFFHKKFDTERFGLAFIGFLAMTQDNKPAAYYGVFPVTMSFGGKDILVAQSGDTMTHSAHRGKGLFIQLARKTYEHAERNGVQFVFGFPNQNSYPGFVNKLNWEHKEDLNVFKIKVRTFPLAKIAKVLPFLSGPYSFYVSLFYQRSSNIFQNSCVEQGFNGLKRNKAFFDYKSYYPNSLVNIAGKNAVIRYDGKIWIGDIEFSSEDEYQSILSALKKRAFWTGATEIVFHLSDGLVLNGLLFKQNVPHSKLPVGYLSFDKKFDFRTIKYTSIDLDTF